MKKQSFLWICCALLILLLLYASASKLAHPGALRHDMYNQPFPHWLASILLWAVPLSEIVISLCLIPDSTRKYGLWGALVLMSLFTLYAAAILLHLFPYVPCSCGGVIRNLTWGQHIVFNLFFVAIAITGILLLKKQDKQGLPINTVYT